jgi:hypothetical protein
MHTQQTPRTASPPSHAFFPRSTSLWYPAETDRSASRSPTTHTKKDGEGRGREGACRPPPSFLLSLSLRQNNSLCGPADATSPPHAHDTRDDDMGAAGDTGGGRGGGVEGRKRVFFCLLRGVHAPTPPLGGVGILPSCLPPFPLPFAPPPFHPLFILTRAPGPPKRTLLFSSGGGAGGGLCHATTARRPLSLTSSILI